MFLVKSFTSSVNSKQIPFTMENFGDWCVIFNIFHYQNK